MIFRALAIFLLQLIYVPLLTLRTTFVVKGQKGKAAMIALLEAIIYIVSLGIVFSDLTNMYNIVAYIIGYSSGIYLGGIIEEKLALGFRCVQVSLQKPNMELVDIIRNANFGVTTFIGEGRNNEPRYRLEIVSHRSRELEVISLVKEIEPSAFVVSYEPTQFKGGYMHKNVK